MNRGNRLERCCLNQRRVNYDRNEESCGPLGPLGLPVWPQPNGAPWTVLDWPDGTRRSWPDRSGRSGSDPVDWDWARMTTRRPAGSCQGRRDSRVSGNCRPSGNRPSRHSRTPPPGSNRTTLGRAAAAVRHRCRRFRHRCRLHRHRWRRRTNRPSASNSSSTGRSFRGRCSRTSSVIAKKSKWIRLTNCVSPILQ